MSVASSEATVASAAGRGIDTQRWLLTAVALAPFVLLLLLKPLLPDWAVLLPDSPRAALGPFLAGIPRRVGYARDIARRMLLTEALRPERKAQVLNGRDPVGLELLRVEGRLAVLIFHFEEHVLVDPDQAIQLGPDLR